MVALLKEVEILLLRKGGAPLCTLVAWDAVGHCPLPGGPADSVENVW